MGIYLNKQGDLTESQKVQADALGVSHGEMRQIMLQRLDDLSVNKKPDTKRTDKMKRTSITAKNPVLIIGAGSSFERSIKEIKEFRGQIIAVDFVFNYLVKKGVIPDYVITLESQQSSVSEKMFEYDNLKKCRNKTKVIASSITKTRVIEHFKQQGIEVQRYKDKGEPRCSNVGLLAVNYAYNVLGADKILLVGFEHVGQKYPPHIYQIWQIDFWYFISKWPKETIINCTNGGVLYYEDYIVDATLDNLVING